MAKILTALATSHIKHLYVSLALFVVYTGWRDPVILEATVFSLMRIQALALIAYWIDRAMFAYARPTAELVASDPGMALAYMLRRVLVFVGVCIVAGGAL